MPNIILKTQLKPQAEPLLVTICYITHHFATHPEMIERAIDQFNLKEHTGWNITLDNIKITKSLFNLFVDFPKYEFSPLITKEAYQKVTSDTIEMIEREYLNVSNNRLTAAEKKLIIDCLMKFYDISEFNIVPYYNRYTATQHDRLAYNVLTKSMFMLGISIIVNTFSKMIKEQKVGAESGNENIQTPENKTIPIGAAILTEINSNEIFELISSPEKAELKDKALDKYYMDTIYEELKSDLPGFSSHRLYILTGYVSYGFGILKEEEYKSSKYTTLNEYFHFKVKGILKKT